MSDYIYPEVTPNQSSLELISNTDSRVSPLSGAVQTVDRTGERLMMTLSHSNLENADRRKLLAFLGLLNGMQHRAYVRDFSYSGPSGTLTVTDVNSALNATDYTTSGATWLELSDCTFGLRITRNGNTANGAAVRPSGTRTVVTGQSYSLRTAIVNTTNLPASGRYAWGTDSGGGGTSGALYDSGYAVHQTKVRAVGVTAPSTAIFISPVDNTPISGLAYDQWEIHRSELARCLLIDNGINELPYSEQFDNAAWNTVRSSVSANPSPGANAPNQTDTADKLVEDGTASQTHYIIDSVSRTSQAEFWTGSVFLKEGENQRIRLDVEDGSSSGAYAFFDASTGTITTSATVYGTAESAYASIHDIGDGWYRCRLSVYLPATTAARMIIYMVNGGTNNITFTGDGTSGIYIWGAVLQQGGQLGRYVQTAGAAATADSQTGTEIWVKGLDADTDGQLLAGDQVQIGDRLCILAADLDGDESGIGLLQLRNRILTAPADEDPVILYRPCGKFILAEQRNGMASRPGVFSDISLQFMEDIAS